MLTFPKVVFLDRDGVINQDAPDYIKSWAEFTFIPGSLEAIRLLVESGYAIIIITNQSMVNRGLAPLSNLDEIFVNMRRAVKKAGGHITDIFFCPHRPDEDCDCRKPEPGLIFQAQVRHSIDLTASIMIGDSAKDIQCGCNAGCGRTILVKTGNVMTAQKQLAKMGVRPDLITENLLEAARAIVSDPNTV